MHMLERSVIQIITHIEKMIGHNHFDDQVMSKLLMKSTPKKNADGT